MKRKRLLWQLFPTYILITFSALLIVGWVASTTLNRFYISKSKADLEVRANLIAEHFIEDFSTENPTPIDSLCENLSRISSTRITFIDTDGVVIGDSERDPASMENHSDRPEIKEAMTGQTGMSIRYSTTLNMNMMYLSVPILFGTNKSVNVLRVAVPLSTIKDALSQARSSIAMGGLIVFMLASMISYFVSRMISNPLVEIKSGAQRFAAGELDHRLPKHSIEELSALATSLNSMASDLDIRINIITNQRNELEAVLSSMVEGVIVVDMNEKLLRVNLSALRFLGIESVTWKDRALVEVVRNPELHEFVSNVLRSHKSSESEIIVKEMFFQIHGTILYDADNREFGALIVFSDITRIRKLENIRREFAANVSHELRTPITSIKGFAETLRDGGLTDTKSSEHFLDIIIKHSDRLSAIIEDLLSLSKIEQETETERLKPVNGKICKVLESAAKFCETKASRKEIQISINCPEEIQTKVINSLLERAIINLLDNAINYSEPKHTVDIKAEKQDAEVIISVSDSGCGIAQEHLPRLFERFFRVDSDRSRKQGGTGLGLAIVKHVALAHKGHVSVESQLGRGSTFKIHLPVG